MKMRYPGSTFVAAAIMATACCSAGAQAPLVSPPMVASDWNQYNDASATATVSAASPSPMTVSNLFFPTDNIASWCKGFKYPDQTKMSVEGNALRVDIGKVDDAKTTWFTYLYQRDLILKQGQAYIVKLRAKADVARQINLIMQVSGADWHDIGLNKPADLTTAWQTFSFPFTAAKMIGIGEQLSIHMGQQTGTVWLSDVSLTPAEGVISIPGPASALQVAIAKPGDHDWSVQLDSKQFDMVEGHKYLLSYYVKSDIVRPYVSLVRINSDDYHSVGAAYGGAIAGPMWRHVLTPFTATRVKANNNLVGFNIGAAGASTVTIGDVTLTEAK